MKTPSKNICFEPGPAESAAPYAQHGGDDSAGNSPTPYSNTGGKNWQQTDPDTGERFIVVPTGPHCSDFKFIFLPDDSVESSSAITDFLSFSFPFEIGDWGSGKLASDLKTALGPRFVPLLDCQRGLNGYSKSFDLGDSTAKLAFGGQRNTAWISLPGKACALIDDWGLLIELFGKGRRARITRWDGAVDSYDGKYSIETALGLLSEGLFNAGGRAPVINQMGNWLHPDGRGRTLNLGRRVNGKLLRVYEKGMQLGAAWHPWVRWELELHNTDRIIPWEVLLKPGEYFVGGYPKALKWANYPASRIRTIQKSQTISYQELTKCASTAYGALLNVMLDVEGSAEAVLSMLARQGTPRRLAHPILRNVSDFIDPSAEDPR